MIHLYTKVRDEDVACELAAQIAEDLVDVPQVHWYSTTVGREDDPGSQQQVFVDVVASGGGLGLARPA